MTNVKFGTCSWNYDSWIGLVYSKKCARSVGYLKEYSQRYRTVEVDSWFYRMPSEKDAVEYLSHVDDTFTFSCKLTQNITLTHERSSGKGDKPLQMNSRFLSTELFNSYVESIKVLLPRISTIMLEFEYLNKDKMSSLQQFMKNIDTFLQQIDRSIPISIETRNKNYIQQEYFEFLKERNVGHVFSEKLYMPHIYEVYEKYGHLLTNTTTVRLLGGDRKEIEEKTSGMWDKIVDEKTDLPIVAEMIQDLSLAGKTVHVYVNNHYEGSAPLTIQKLEALLEIEKNGMV